MERKKRTIEGGWGGGGGKRSLVGQLKAVQTVEFQETVLRICSSQGDLCEHEMSREKLNFCKMVLPRM